MLKWYKGVRKVYTESLAPKLKKTRQEAGYTQQQVADLIGMPQSTIARFEKGLRIPDSEQCRKLRSVQSLFGTGLL